MSVGKKSYFDDQLHSGSEVNSPPCSSTSTWIEGMGEPRSDTALSMLPVDSLPALLLLVTLWFDGILKQKFIDQMSTS
jgi:hypothetical protein